MIIRSWRCIASGENVVKYMAHFQYSVLPELRQLAGFQRGYILQKPAGDGVELTVLTFWESMDAIRGFAGDDVERAVVEPAAQAVLRSFDSRVTHYEVILDTDQL
ncbi:MAG TPA: hypothetical protein VHL11_01765 [Phototrophicaceae bacterium]|jgi:heme-degrading monooxygenase HmoA|nr:hypothetical protein [Phototrophicaceae bacterium]